MSGQYGPRHGVYTVNNSDRGESRHRKLIPTKNTLHLKQNNLTIAGALRNGGDRTIHLGKWHLGKDPLSQGFDENIGGNEDGGPKGEYFSPYSVSTMKPYNDRYPPKTHRVDIFSDQAIRFMREHRGEPFFMHMAYYSVHTKLEPVPEYVEKYRGKEGVHATYASMVEKMDEGVGKILDELDVLGLKENTLVVFCSDNGGIAQYSSQKPYRSGKGSYFEGGIREPLVARWPSKVTAGSTCDVPVIGTDFFPTFLDAAGLGIPAGKILDGESLMPLLTGEGSFSERALFWHFPVYLQKNKVAKDATHDALFRCRPGSALREGKWKLHEYFEDGRLELYDLESDVGESENLASRFPEKARELHLVLKRWRSDLNAPVPTKLNPEYDSNALSK